MKIKKVLVIGGTGFIGSHLVDTLIKRGYKVRCLVRKTSNLKWIEDHVKKNRIDLAYGDIVDKKSLELATKGVDVVYNLATIIDERWVRYEDFKKINLVGTKNIVEACIKNQVKKFIYFSSIAAVGMESANHPINEQEHCKPTTLYGKSKYEAEKFLNNVIKQNKINIVILRPPTVYGPREAYNTASLFRTIQQGKFKIIGNGKNLMSFCFIKNVVDAAILAMERETANNETFFITDERAYSLQEFAETIAKEYNVKISKIHIPYWIAYFTGFCFETIEKITRKKALLSRDRVKTMTSTYTYNISKAKKLLGYNPKYNLQTGVKETAKWYKENGYYDSKKLS